MPEKVAAAAVASSLGKLSWSASIKRRMEAN